MEILVSGHGGDAKLEKYIHRKISKMERLLAELERAKVHLSYESNPRISENEICEVTLEGHGHHIRCKASASDKFAAVDLSVSKLEKQLRKQKTQKLNRWQRGSSKSHHS